MHETALADYRARLERAAFELARRNRVRRRRLATAFALAAAAMLAATSTLAATGLLSAWMGGTPAPSEVRDDFAAIRPELGHVPESDKAAGVAADGEFVLYATPTTRGGLCLVADVPWLKFDGDGRGYCVKREVAERPLVAGIVGGGPDSSGADTAVVAGRVRVDGAAAVRFSAPGGEPVERRLDTGGFFVAAVESHMAACFGGTEWSPTLVVTDAAGRELSRATFPLLIPGRDAHGRPLAGCSVMSPMSDRIAARILRKQAG